MLGLTGGIACGKSTVSRKLDELGAVHIDADAISRSLTAPNGAALGKVRETFGDGVFNADGTLDRRALAAVIFADEAQKRALEGIIHPMVQHRMLEIADEAAETGKKVCVLDVPLLYETGMDVLCDEVWVVTLPQEKQIVRVMGRDRLTRAEAIARIENQMPLEEKEARAAQVFRTDKSEQETMREIERAYRDLIKKLDRR